MIVGASIDAVDVAVYKFPTDRPESDGTLTWDATTAVTATVHAGRWRGLGWTYSAAAAAQVITDQLAPAITGREIMDIPGCWSAMHRACRNLGTRGLVMQAISAVDIALWDLKAHALDVSLTQLFGRAVDTVPVYGSGGFTTLTDAELAAQVTGWAAAGCTAMKIKIGQAWGTAIERDIARITTLADLAGPGVDLMVDANGGYTAGQARRVGATLDRLGVVWFEEPVSSDDLPGLAAVRATVHCDVAPGNTAPTSTTPAGCVRWWTACNWTPPAAAATPDGSAAPPSPRRITCRSPRTAPPPCTRPCPPPYPTCGTSNGSSTTPASNRC